MYILTDLLIHYEQWIVAALVIKLCTLPQINQRSHVSDCCTMHWLVNTNYLCNLLTKIDCIYIMWFYNIQKG